MAEVARRRHGLRRAALWTGLVAAVLLLLGGGLAALGVAHLERWGASIRPIGDVGLHTLASAVSEPDGGFAIAMVDHELATLLRPLLVGGADGRGAVEDLRVEVLEGSAADPARLRLDLRVRPSEPLDAVAVPVRTDLGVAVDSGLLAVAIRDVRVGGVPVPAPIHRPLGDLVARVAGAAVELSHEGVELTRVRTSAGRLLLEGRSEEHLPIARERIARLRSVVRMAAGPWTAPVPPGRVAGPHAPGPDGGPWVLGLGDSVAAGLGVDDARAGMLSRVHAAWERRTGTTLGLRNLARIGERTDTLRWGGQLRQALTFLDGHDVELVVLSLGANDVLTELTQRTCRRGWTATGCDAHLGQVIRRAAVDLDVVLGALRRASPDTEMVLLTAYNPLSFGSDDPLEAVAAETITALARTLAEVASDHGWRVAHGFAALDGAAQHATGILESPPDIHPDATGHALLAGAVLDALRVVPVPAPVAGG